MTVYTKYRSRTDGKIVEAVQYGGADGVWTPEETTKIAAFVLGVDPDSMTVVSNEHVLDVVKPVLTDWNAEGGRAPLEVSYIQGGLSYRLELGDWIVRNKVRSTSGHTVYSHAFLTRAKFPYEYELLFDDLADVIYNECMEGLEGELYQALAEKIASVLIDKGWTRRDV